MPADDEPNAPGLARERTALATNRSGLAVVVCLAVLLRHLWPLSGADEPVVLGLIAAAAIIWALAILRLRAYRDGRRSGSPPGDRAFGLMTAATVVLAIGGITLTLLTPG